MITFSLDWEMRDGASDSEHYADELEALEEMEDEEEEEEEEDA